MTIGHRRPFTLDNVVHDLNRAGVPLSEPITLPPLDGGAREWKAGNPSCQELNAGLMRWDGQRFTGTVGDLLRLCSRLEQAASNAVAPHQRRLRAALQVGLDALIATAAAVPSSRDGR